MAPRQQPLDRVEVIVDAELGILLRHEEIFQGQPLSLTELVSVSFDPAQAADDAQFQPPSGWAAAEKNAKPTPPDVLDSDLVKLTMTLMAGGLGALIKPSSSDPFGQATREEPETAMPEDEHIPPEACRSATRCCTCCTPARSARCRGSRPRCTAGLTSLRWLSRGAGSGPASGARPDRLSRGRGGPADTHRAPRSTRLRISRSGPVPDRRGGPGPRRRARPRHDQSATGSGAGAFSTDTGEGRRGPTAPPTRVEIANLLDPSWLLEARLTRGTETVIGGRRGYRLAIAPDLPLSPRIPITLGVLTGRGGRGRRTRVSCWAG